MIAAALLLLLSSLQEPGSDYRRFSWPDWDRDGLNTRHELLNERCAVIERNGRGRAVQVICIDQYTGERYEGPALGLDVEHVLAWVRVFFQIPPEHWNRLREIYADTRNLILTNRSLNRSKGGKSLAEFCPPDPRLRPWLAALVSDYVDHWGIVLLPDDEAGRLAWSRGVCVGQG